MSKSKTKKYYIEDRDYLDGNEVLKTRDEKAKDKRKEKRLVHALKTKNLDELLSLEEDDDDWE